MRIVLATCRSLPSGVEDDAPLIDALASRSVTAIVASWDDPTIDWSSFDGCLIRSTWDYPKRREEFLRWATEVDAVTALHNPLSILRWNTHKAYLRDLEQAGVATLATVWIDRGASADVAALVGSEWTSAILKPAIGATSRELIRFELDTAGLREAQTHVDRLIPNEDLLLQPFVATVERQGERSMMFIDGVFSHAVQKRPCAGEFRVQDEFGGSHRRVTPTDLDLELCRQALSCVSPTPLYARVDLLHDESGAPRVIELELVEPVLYFRHEPGAARRLAATLLQRLGE